MYIYQAFKIILLYDQPQKTAIWKLSKALPEEKYHFVFTVSHKRNSMNQIH